MADIISRLKLESGEFDSKIKRAGQELLAYSEHCKKMGLEMGYANKDAKEFVKQLGGMETVSKTARGKINELTETFTNLKVMYNSMTDVEKNGEFGKNLAASLEQIKQRAQEARAQLDNASKSLSDNGQEAQQSSSALDALASKFTINIDALKLFNIGLKAAKGALDVAKDAFMSSEANVDEWGRVMDSSKSLYEGFLTALNTGDISGYLNNIDSIVQAARTAYNELDRLGTMKTIQAPQMSAQQTENERIRSMIQTGRYIAPIDGRRNAVFNGREMQSGDKLTAGQIRALEKQLQNGMQKVVGLVGNEVKQTSKAIDAVYNRQAKELGMDLSEFRKGTSSMAEFDKRMAGYDQYQKWRNENYYTDNWGNRRVKEGNPFEEYKKWGTFRVDGERYNDLVRLIQQRDQQAGQAYGMQSQAYRAMNRAEGFTVSKLMKGDTTKSGKSTKTEQTELQQNQQKINDLTQEYVKLGDQSTETARERQAEIQKEIALLEKRNGLLGLRAEQAQGRLLSNDDIKRKAEIDIQVNTKQIEDLRRQLTEIKGVTIDPKTVDVNANTSEAQQKIDELKTKIAELEDKNITIKAFVKSIEKPLGEGLNKTTGTLLKAPETDIPRGGLQLDEKAMKAVRKNIDDSLPKAEKKESPMEGSKKMLNAISQLTGGLQQMGIELPSEIQGVIGVIQGAMQVIEAVNTIIGVTQTSALTANTAAMISLEAALWANTSTSWIPFANGGIVPGFANGGVIDSGNSPSFLSFSKAAPAFATGGVVPQVTIPMPKFATGGVIQKFNDGGTVEAGHAPDFLSFSKTMPKFATGGTIPHAANGYYVPGNHYSGDVTPIMANAGELVLNKSQQYNLASQLSGNSFENLNLTATIRGEQIRLALNNNGRRTGRGEYVQSRNIR